MSQSQSNPWKVATFCIIASIAGALAAGVVVARVQDARHEVAQQTASASAEVENEPATEIAPIPEVEPAPQPVVVGEADIVRVHQQFLHRRNRHISAVLAHQFAE